MTTLRTPKLFLLTLLLSAAALPCSAQQSPYKPYQDYLPQGIALQSTVVEFQGKMPKVISMPQTPGKPNQQEFADPAMRAKPVEVIVYRFIDGKLAAVNFEGGVPTGVTAAAVLTQLRSVVLSGFGKVREETVQILNEWKKESAIVELFERNGTQESAYLLSAGQTVRLVVFDRSKVQRSDFFPDVSSIPEQDLQKFREKVAPANP
jgi:hypothetical protein